MWLSLQSGTTLLFHYIFVIRAICFESCRVEIFPTKILKNMMMKIFLLSFFLTNRGQLIYFLSYLLSITQVHVIYLSIAALTSVILTYISIRYKYIYLCNSLKKWNAASILQSFIIWKSITFDDSWYKIFKRSFYIFSLLLS